MENPNPESAVNIEKLKLDISRFSDLSSEMVELLSNLSQEIDKSAASLQEIQSELDVKRKELATLNEIEMLATSLEQQIQDLRQQKENLDHVVAEQHTVWENEKERRAREEREYVENLNACRQQEEVEYQKVWSAKQERARQRLDDEMRAIQLEKQDAQTAIETGFQEREMLLKKKELEWGQLIQELEQFLYKLERNHRSHDTIHAVRPNGTSGEQPGCASSEAAPSGNKEDDNFCEEECENPPDLRLEDGSVLDNGMEDAGFQNGSNGSIIGRDCDEEPKQSPLVRRESAPLKFSPKRSVGLKPDA